VISGRSGRALRPWRAWRSWRSRLLVALFAAATSVAGRPTTPTTLRAASAATPLPSGVRLEASVDRAVVGVGQTVNYTVKLSTTVSGLRASVATAGKTPGFVVAAGPFTGISTVSTQQNFGPTTEVTELTTTFQLRARELGEHVLGPGQMRIGTVTYDAPTVKVTVVVPSKLAPAPMPPLGLRGRPSPMPLDDEPAEPPLPERFEPSDPAAKLDAPPTDPQERVTFARLVAEPKSAVVGQAIVVKAIVYRRLRIGFGAGQAATFADFAMVPLPDDMQEFRPITIGTETWEYAVAQRHAAFPLKTGRLTIAGFELGMQGHPAGLDRVVAPPLVIEVTEPPEQGRPAEYRVGDVASNLGVQNEVAPRVTPDGHAVVTVRLAGVGRLDHLEPIMPSGGGVTFTKTSEETKTETRGTQVIGHRTVVYDAAAARVDTIELGIARVLVWDPSTSKYVTATSALGSLTARVAVAPTAPSANAEPKLELPAPRNDPGERGEGSTIADRAWTWLFVAGAPLLVLSAQGAAKAARSMRKRVVARRDDPTTRTKQALREARALEAKGDEKGAAAASARALELVVEAATDGALRVRGMTGAELRARLPERGIEAALAERVASTLNALETARFAGGLGPRAAEVAALVDAIAQASASGAPRAPTTSDVGAAKAAKHEAAS
jgi:hypothetical protein